MLSSPNIVSKSSGFYISYNPIDVGIYGDVTTALVNADMTVFYILNGNHRLELEQLKSSGFNACLQYVKNNIHMLNKFSDKPI